MQPGFGLGVLREQVPGPGEGVGGGLVTGEEDGERLVADLRIDECGAVLVARGDEHGEQVAGVGPGGAVLGDEAVDDLVEAGAGAAEVADAPDGNGEGKVEHGLQPGEGDEEVVDLHDGVDLVVDAADVVGDLGVEEGAGDDLEREGHHGGGDVDDVAGSPCGGVRLRAGDDLVGVGGDALAVEGRGDDAAVAHVDGVVGGDEPFAEEDLHAADGALLHEGRGLRDEDLLDEGGVVDEDDGRAHEAVVGDGAVGAMQVLEEADGLAEFDPRLVGVEGQREAKARGQVPAAHEGLDVAGGRLEFMASERESRSFDFAALRSG